jgi:hypothetical protein
MTEESLIAVLESMRRGVNLRLDRHGVWWQDGERFQHPHIIRAFNRGIDIHGQTSEGIVRIGGKWAYVECDKTPFLVLSIEMVEPEALACIINNEERWVISQGSLFEDDETVYARKQGPSSRRYARFSRHAQGQLAEYLMETADGFALNFAGKVWPIAPKSSC